MRSATCCRARPSQIDGAYLEGMNKVFAYMTMAKQPTWIRVSSVTYDGDAKALVLNWSHATGSHPATTMTALQDWIPLMAAGDSVIVVETFMPYTPDFNVGLKPMVFRQPGGDPVAVHAPGPVLGSLRRSGGLSVRREGPRRGRRPALRKPANRILAIGHNSSAISPLCGAQIQQG